MKPVYDVVIIGAGIVGLATAYQLKSKNPHLSIAILDKEKKEGSQQTSHNSGVIHTGVYYVPGSLKAKNCVEGRKELIHFCDKHHIPTKALGKVMVATEESQLPTLQKMARRGRANGVEGLELVGPERLKEIEPYAGGIQALWLPTCAIVNFSEVASHIAKEIQEKGGEIYLGERVEKIIPKEDSCEIITSDHSWKTKLLINCAGIFADQVAKMVLPKIPLQIIPFRAAYFRLPSNKAPFIRGLIYPVGDLNFPFSGIHFTPRMDGRVEVGSNAVLTFSKSQYKKFGFEWREAVRIFMYPGFWKMGLFPVRVGWRAWFRPFSKKTFLQQAQKLVPTVEEKDLLPGMMGIRANVVSRKGEIVPNFHIEEKKHMLHVLTVPSPAATACFSIGRFLAEKALAHL